MVEPNKKGSLFIQSLSKNGQSGGPESSRRSVYSEAEEEGYDRQRLIVRQSSMRAAVDLVVHKVLAEPEFQGKTTLSQLFGVAEKIENWVFRDEGSH